MAAGRCICSAVTWGSGVVEENTSKVFVAGDANLAAAAVLNASGPSAGQGTSLFVINLCASMAPLANVAKSLPGLDAYRLYQVARREDGRTRYRLRLGFFTSEADAESVLNSVRDSYPTAFTACLCDEDRKFARGYVPDGAISAAPAAKIAVVVENKPVAKVEPPKSAPVAPVAKTTAKAATTDTVTLKTLSPQAKPATPSKTAKPASLDATAKHKRIVEPVAKSEPVAKKEGPGPVPGKAAGSAPPIASSTPSAEIELSWDPPALQAPANAAAVQVVAPTFKTQDVIKAPTGVTPRSTVAAPVATKAPAKPAVQPARVDSTRAQAAKPAATKDVIAAPSTLLADIELTLESESKATPAKAPAAPVSNEPFRVGKGIEIPQTALTLELSEPAAATAAPASITAKPAAAKPMAEVSKMKAAHATATPAIKAAVTPTSVRKVDGPPPDLDSTQTIRALTSDELQDDSQEKWFAIQLAVSDQPVNLDTMPRLDIFEAYRLYSVASAGGGKITHSLRIGFFREDHSAEAVAGYLKTFFNSPTVVRISIAEQARFKDPPAAKPAAMRGEGKVLDLSHARDRAPKAVPTVTMEVETKKFDPMATGSFKANATGAHKALATGAHNALSATGTHKSLNATGTHNALSATGAHKALKAASKSSAPPTKRSQPLSKGSMTGKHKALQQKKSLSQQLLDEAREVELSQSGIRKLPQNDSLFAKMFGKKK
jgi:hypothetical protein